MSKSPSFQKLPPGWLIAIISAFRTFLVRLNRKLFPGNVVLYEQFQSFWLLPTLYVAAKLDIAGLLRNKPLTAREISDHLGADTSNITRILRALCSQEIFKETTDGRFALNAMSKGLLDGPGSLRYMILHHLGPVNWNLMSNLEYTVRTGRDAFSEKYGKPAYEFLKDHPEEYDVFDKSMSNLSDLGLAPILNAYDFSPFSLIADIGGGEGYLLSKILQYHPSCNGLLFDTAEALVKAPHMLAVCGVEDRTLLVPGSFFEAIPAGADLYILKNIIHNWSDSQCTQILKTIHEGMPSHSRLLIIEMVVPSGNEPSLAKLLDIQMMATMAEGKERTAAEYTSLLERSGLQLSRIIPTIAPICLIEARKNG
jgi:hypothetical protein